MIDHARYLVTQYAQAEGVHRWNGRPVLAVDWSADGLEGAQIFVEAVEDTGILVFWAGPSSGARHFGDRVVYRWSDCGLEAFTAVVPSETEVLRSTSELERINSCWI